MKAFIGIDVGTGSARAAVFDSNGKMLAQAVHEIKTWKPQPDFVEQSSDNIWTTVCECVRRAVASSKIDPADILGIGFDATCSLVAIDQNGAPVTLSPTGDDQQNVIVWMDHRAAAEAEEINQGNYSVLDYVGGKISPEMETPKLLWVKRNLTSSWNRSAHFFDLPDFLTWRATGDLTRSLCSTVCKMTYLGHQEEGWDKEYFNAIGLGQLVDEGFERIGKHVAPMGTPLGSGLSEQAANELGLNAGTAVSVSIIDAHAGGIGLLGAAIEGNAPRREDLNKRLALIGGTSSCHMAVSPEARFIDGIWGPYYSAMVPGFWLTEGGQSATGSLIDLIAFESGASKQAMDLAQEQGVSIYEILNARLNVLSENRPLAVLTERLHVCPYFHGNRSPRANPHLRGMVSGLRLSANLDNLALLYLATIQAIAYGTRHIIDAMNQNGYAIDTIVACGGGTKNPVFVQQHADITGCRIVLPEEPEAVLLGSAMLGATAAGEFGSLTDAMAAMSKAGEVVNPHDALADYHAKKYRVFHQMYEDQIRYDKLME